MASTTAATARPTSAFLKNPSSPRAELRRGAAEQPVGLPSHLTNQRRRDGDLEYPPVGRAALPAPRGCCFAWLGLFCPNRERGGAAWLGPRAACRSGRGRAPRSAGAGRGVLPPARRRRRP